MLLRVSIAPRIAIVEIVLLSLVFTFFAGVFVAIGGVTFLFLLFDDGAPSLLFVAGT